MVESEAVTLSTCVVVDFSRVVELTYQKISTTAEVPVVCRC